MRRRAFIAGLAGAAAWPFVTVAQPSSALRRIGVLQGIGDDPQREARNRAFLDGLQQLGWTDGVNVKIDMRSSNAGDANAAALAMNRTFCLCIGSDIVETMFRPWKR